MWIDKAYIISSSFVPYVAILSWGILHFKDGKLWFFFFFIQHRLKTFTINMLRIKKLVPEAYIQGKIIDQASTYLLFI